MSLAVGRTPPECLFSSIAHVRLLRHHLLFEPRTGPGCARPRPVQLLTRLRRSELLTADRNFYSWAARELAARTGAGLLWRAPTQLELSAVTVLPDGTHLSMAPGRVLRSRLPRLVHGGI
jgi:hypothetical protein